MILQHIDMGEPCGSSEESMRLPSPATGVCGGWVRIQDDIERALSRHDFVRAYRYALRLCLLVTEEAAA